MFDLTVTYHQGDDIVKKMSFGFLAFVSLLALVAVVSAALPTSVQLTATYSNTPPSYWHINIDSTTPSNNYELPTGPYLGWCSDIKNVWVPDGNTFTPYSSLNPGSIPAEVPHADWKAINYIINHKGNYDWNVIQAVIWHYDGWDNPSTNPTHWSINYNPSDYNALLADVEANFNAYTPGSGDRYAVIMWQKEHVQAVFVEALVERILPPPPVPEFPTFALPAGMIIGMVGAVYFIKGREY
jgi:hypothetical protein